MKVVLDGDNTTITLTAEQLGILRYTLNTGAEKLTSDMNINKALKTNYYKSSKRTADEAQAVNEELEAAVQKAIRS